MKRELAMAEAKLQSAQLKKVDLSDMVKEGSAHEIAKIRLLEVDLMLKFCSLDERLTEDLIKKIKLAKKNLIAEESDSFPQPHEKSILVAQCELALAKVFVKTASPQAPS